MKQLLREGGASREFYYSELVTHIISDGPVSASVEGVSGDFNKHTVVHVSFMPLYSYYEKVYFLASDPLLLFSPPYLQSDWVKMSLKCGAQLPYLIVAVLC